MCGVVGILSSQSVAEELYESLIHLQHRGQDAAGILTCDHKFHLEKGSGLVQNIFTPTMMESLNGNFGIGHVRYSTCGDLGDKEAQPMWTAVPYGVAIAYNGNIVNYHELFNELKDRRQRYVDTTGDTELILQLFADYLSKSTQDFDFFTSVCESVNDMFNKAIGAISAVFAIVDKGLVAIRDPHGIRPLVYGTRIEPNGRVSHIVASETTMFYSLGYTKQRDVEPGEVIYINLDGEIFSKIINQKTFHPCIFEYVYFARPDSFINNVSVYRSRLRMGQNLAKQWKKTHPELVPDIVIPAPSTANTAALSLASELGVRYSEGLYKNPFIGRTFLMPGAPARRNSVRYKLSPQETEIRDKRVMIVDDSIVRGTTSQEIVKMLREFGAKEIYFVSASPPIKYPCYYGVDIPLKKDLIASYMSIEDICEYLGADKILYQTVEGLVEAVTRKGNHSIAQPCLACMNGHYVTDLVDEDMLKTFYNDREKRSQYEHSNHRFRCKGTCHSTCLI